LGTRTGTFLNGHRISEEKYVGAKPLNDQDVVGLIPVKDGYLVNIRYNKSK
tara:strand:+ start:228 stop:380 length:153 start_codon:yes stop_codon:yes gene_type:complete